MDEWEDFEDSEYQEKYDEFKENLENFIRKNNTKKVLKLIPDLNMYKDHSILYYTMINNNIDMFEYMVKKNYRDENLLIDLLCRPLRLNSSKKIYRKVLQHITDINKIYRYGDTALHLLVKLDNTKINSEIKKWLILKLLKYGADPCIKNDDLASCIDIALSKEDEESLTILIKHVDKKNIDISHDNFIEAIVENNNYDIIDMVLPYVKDINLRDYENKTALWHAKNKRNPNYDIIELLEESGAII